MFKHDEDFAAAKLSAEARALERTYTLQPNDLIEVKVYTKNGEMIIDPEYQLSKDIGNNRQNQQEDPEYLVRLDGMVLLPMVGEVNVAGLTLHETNLKLKDKYDEYFIDPYIITNYTNKRVVVMGSPGGQLLPLTNNNITVAEVIAMSGGMQENGNATSIKLIRGNEIFLIDFSTVEGYRASNQIVQPGDIVYIEPIKRFFQGNAVEISVMLSLITTATTLLILILQ